MHIALLASPRAMHSSSTHIVHVSLLPVLLFLLWAELGIILICSLEPKVTPFVQYKSFSLIVTTGFEQVMTRLLAIPYRNVSSPRDFKNSV